LRCSGGLAGIADHCQGGPDFSGLVLRDDDLENGAGDRGGDLGVDLVGGDLHDGLVDLDGVADLLQPSGDSAFGDAFTQCWEGDIGRHARGLLLR
jgi:hypothetical protein